MNKTRLLEQISLTLEAVHRTALKATAQAQDTATNKNNVAENKYDTLGLEAAYLAHGQAQRVVECEIDLAAYKNLKALDFTDETPVALGAMILLKDESGSEQSLFLGPAAGGLKFSFEEKEYLIITPSAPLGRAVLGCFVYDEVELNLGGQIKRFEIIAIA